MDQIIQPLLKITEEIQRGLDNGDLIRISGVIRDAKTGQIVVFLEEIVTNETSNLGREITETVKTSASVVVKKSTASSLGKKFAVGTIIVVGVAAIGYGSYRLYTYLKKRSEEKKQEGLIDYNPELTEYFNNMQTQSMSLSSVKKVVDFFDHYSSGDLSIEITEQELLVIRNLIVRYTIKLCESNNISIDNKQLVIEAKAIVKSELMQDIVYATRVQEEIFAMANNEPR